MQYREVTDEGTNFITGYEKRRLRAYDDKQPNRTSFSSVAEIKGTATIGWGHIDTVTKQDVVNGRTITVEEAVALKKRDMAKTYAKIYAILGAGVVDALNDHQYDALVSFVYNAGLASGWKIARLLKAKRFNEVPDEMIRFVNSKGERMQGLVNRRRAEIDIWRKAETVSVEEVPHEVLATAPVEAQPAKTALASHTVKASLAAGAGTVVAATTEAVNVVSPHAAHNNTLAVVLTTLLILSAVAAFVAAALRANDQKGSAA